MNLLNKGFIKSDNPNEYLRGNWVIRLNDDTVEVFNDPDVSPGIYYYGKYTNEVLEQIISEIDEISINGLYE